VNDEFWQTLPDEFEAKTYRSLHLDLDQLADAELLDHYENFGRNEGRTANGLRDRNDFLALIPQDAAILEIGPFNTPLLSGPNVSYFDVLPQDELIVRATSIGLDPAGVPHIDYVSPMSDLSIVKHCFDVVISSHCLEHQPDLIGHLKGVRKLLRPGGAFFILMPDKRYCFDHFIPLSNLAEIIVAHRERRKTHALRSVIEHRVLTTHNDPLRHWRGDHGNIFDDVQWRVQAALDEFDSSNGSYIDVHAWYFTPDSFSAILSALQSAKMSPLGVHRIYPTRYYAAEFWTILKIGPGREPRSDRET
jgi:SAM-dependent methyltransferase